jgi:predicted transcriptional regulator
MLPASTPSSVSHTAVLRLILGPLETEVMEILWRCGGCRGREVRKRLNRSVAYTTVMSTLERLFRKNLVSRRMLDRAYFYSPRVTHQEWEDKVARDVVTKLLAGSRSSPDLLIACLLEAVGRHDELLRQEIEKNLRERCNELRNGSGISGGE